MSSTEYSSSPISVGTYNYILILIWHHLHMKRKSMLVKFAQSTSDFPKFFGYRSLSRPRDLYLHKKNNILNSLKDSFHMMHKIISVLVRTQLWTQEELRNYLCKTDSCIRAIRLFTAFSNVRTSLKYPWFNSVLKKKLQLTL